MNEILIPAAKRMLRDISSPSWIIPEFSMDGWRLYLESNKDKQFDRLLIKIPSRPRTTGKHSQCNRVNGFVQQICKQKGLDFDVLKYYLKKKAIGRGYPFKTDPEGEAAPDSESTINTVQAGYLIETIEQFAAENSIHLVEDVLDLI